MGFYAANDVLSKKYNLWHIEKRGDLQLKLNQGFKSSTWQADYQEGIY